MATDDGPIGRYGTIHYMKRSEDVPLVSYPVDDDTVTFGRSNDVVACQIRLYDLWASGRHCQLIFNDGKAFLRIYGQNGVTVDGTHYMPSKDELSPTTVPLTNGSEFLIYKRRFVFQYPPKEQRATLLATPRPKSRKSLRMSMVNSAQVWTPNPRAKPEENLEMLRSPVKAFEDQQPITMLEGEPVYVQDDGEDLIVVEKVDAPEPLQPKPPTSPRKPQTPSLHRAVLQRNAQRSLQKLNEVEEREVEDSVAQALNFDSRFDEEDEDDEEDEEGESQEEQKRPSLPVSPFSASVFRKSLSALGSILPFGSGSPDTSTEAADAEQTEGQDLDADSAKDEIPEVIASMHSEEEENEAEEDEEEEEEEEEEGVAPPSRPHQLTSFYTPQVSRTSGLAFKSHLGMSVGGKITGDEDPSDLESARRQLEAIRKLPRPVLIRAPDDSDDGAPTASAAPVPTTPGRTKSRPRLSSILKPLPELGSSPTRQTTFSNRLTDDEDDWDPSTPKAKDIEAFNTGTRLQEVMRQVQHARRRESIREARRSFAPEELFGIGIVGTETKDEEMVGENETKDAPTPKAIFTSATHVPATPNYTGVPGLFKNPPLPPKTPSFQGVTRLFSNPAIPAATPAYDGVKSIFASPPPLPPALETRGEAEDIEMADVQEEERVETKEVKTPANKGRKVKKSTSAAVQTQQDEVEHPVPKSTKRGRKAATPAVEPEEIPEPTPTVSKRRTRSQSVEPTEEVAVPATATRSRRGRTPALEETEETVQATPTVNRASKRGKKAAVVVEEPPLEVIDEDIQMDVEPAGRLAPGPSTKRTRNAKAIVVEEETLTPTSGKRKTNTRSSKVPTAIEEDIGSDHIPEAEAEAINTVAPSKSRSRKMKASEDSITPSSRLPRAPRALRTPLMDSTTSKDEEQEVEADLVANTGKKTPGASKVKGVRSTGSSGARSKSSSAATSSSSARRAKGVDENTAPAVLEPAARVTRTRGRK